ncbi:hypothetical protein sos41_13640 [Alphaproteobacteria bacterium SO-S41]|nr:hypothetical protein sos41_13640 [Alphaproteobacteria bacterium SO-S41]
MSQLLAKTGKLYCNASAHPPVPARVEFRQSASNTTGSLPQRQPLKNHLRRFTQCQRGVAAIEFAFIAPVLLVFLLGVICYGAYFWMAHDVQQLANDGARSAIAGLDAAERSAIARQTVQRNLSRQDGLVAAKAAVTVKEGNDAFTVTVSYDASGSPFWNVIELFPMPSTTIRRSATVTLGGY